VEITEVRIKLMDDPNDRLQAFCSITFDSSFVIRDLKIIQGAKGSFVAMPSRKLTDRCPNCHNKNHLRSQHCNQCGARLQEDRALKDEAGRAKLYADIAHPINSDCREMIQRRVLECYQEELTRSKMPDYVCTYDDFGEDRYASLHDELDGETGYRNQRSHRIEAAADRPRSPHHNGQATAREHARASATQSAARNPSEEEGFGAGIV
jgi:stage V sporulation protein G